MRTHIVKAVYDSIPSWPTLLQLPNKEREWVLDIWTPVRTAMDPLIVAIVRLGIQQ